MRPACPSPLCREPPHGHTTASTYTRAQAFTLTHAHAGTRNHPTSPTPHPRPRHARPCTPLPAYVPSPHICSLRCTLELHARYAHQRGRGHAHTDLQKTIQMPKVQGTKRNGCTVVVALLPPSCAVSTNCSLHNCRAMGAQPMLTLISARLLIVMLQHFARVLL